MTLPLRSESVTPQIPSLRCSHLQIGYPSDPDSLKTIAGALANIDASITLIAFPPLTANLARNLSPVLQVTGKHPSRVLLLLPEGKVEPDQETAQNLLKLLPSHGAKAFELRGLPASARDIPDFARLPAGGIILLFSEPQPGDTLAVLADGTQQDHIALRWTWGDPAQRVQKLSRQFDALWSNPHARPVNLAAFTPLVDTTGYNFPPLFDHQQKAIAAWQENKFQGIFKMCTGSGKTLAALAGSLKLHQSLALGEPSLSAIVILCPTKVLLEQWQRELLKRNFLVSALVYDDPNNYLSQLDVALRSRKPRCVISTYDSFCTARFAGLLQSAASAGRRGLLIADEMHSAASAQRRNCLRDSGNYFKWRLGLSATPEIETDEAATNRLMEFFGGIVAEYGLEQALKDGVLCPYVYRPYPVFLDPETSRRYFTILRRTTEATGRVNLTDYSERRKILRKADLQKGALEGVCSQIAASGSTFDDTLVFCPPGPDFDESPEDESDTVPLINSIKKIFQDREVLCTAIVAETKNREQALADFEQHRVSILLAIGCLDEGMDVPSTRRAVMLYSVDRLRQFVQRRGRVLRRHPAKDKAEIIDLIVLPHNADLPESLAEELLQRELRRYEEFARLASNPDESGAILKTALLTAKSRTRSTN